MKKIAKIVKIVKKVKVMITVVVKIVRTQYQVQNYQTHQRIMFMSKTNKHSQKI